MAYRLIWGILGGVVIGAAFGYAYGNTAIGIAICIAAGAVVARRGDSYSCAKEAVILDVDVIT